MQTFTDEHRYPRPVTPVLEKYTDPGFLQRKYTELGRQDIRLLEHTQDAQRVRIRMTYSDSADMDLPDFARRLVPERAQVVQTVEWELIRRLGTIIIDAKGSPAKVSGEMQLSEREGHCINTIRWSVSCSIPLVGGKLEKLLIEGLRRKARKDEEVSRKLLAA